MRFLVVLNLLGRFLQIFAALMLVPVALGLYYGEASHILNAFIVPSLVAFGTGTILSYFGNYEDLKTSEALYATVFGWVLAIVFGAIPFLIYVSPIDALFEASSGITTTGFSVLEDPTIMENSMLFWRSFLQWIGGLGILTFFIAVLRESSGVSQRLFSAEAHKTDPGSIRPSLKKSIIDLWRVYGFFTSAVVLVYVFLGMPVFESFVHAFSSFSTGGFSILSESIGGYNSTSIELATTFFMLVGGINFVLIYRFLLGDFKALFKNSEFKLYFKVFIALFAVLLFDLIGQGPINNVLIDALFQAAAVISSTGYSTMPIMSFSIAVQFLLIGVMFVGGSLGSTSGGFKIFRLKTLIELLKRRIKAFALPKSAINEVKIDGEIIRSDTIRTISVLFFIWVSVTFILTIIIMTLEGKDLMAVLSSVVSAMGNMGPMFMEQIELIEFSWVSKLILIVAMIAGRLEMLPVLAIFNRKIIKD